MSIFERWNEKPPTEKVRDILPRYCGRCGKPLERQSQDLGYSTETGRPQFRYWLRCPDAEHKDTPYRPSLMYSQRARYVTCEMDAWAEKVDIYSDMHRVAFISCEPWPKPVVVAGGDAS